VDGSETLVKICFTSDLSKDKRISLFENGCLDIIEMPVSKDEFKILYEKYCNSLRNGKEKLGSVMQGKLEDFSIIDIVQSLEDGKKTAIIELIRNGDGGQILINKGMICSAEYGKYKGLEAILNMIGWIRGDFYIEFTDQDFEKEIERIVELGFPGIKFHGEFQRFRIDNEKMLPVYQAISDAGLCLFLHAGEELLTQCEHRATPKMICKIVERVPELKVIAAHGGGFRMWEEFLECLAGNPNVWIDLSMTPGYMPDETKERIFEKHGWERILFGSDFPWMSPGIVLKYIRELGLSEEKEKAISGENAAKLVF